MILIKKQSVLKYIIIKVINFIKNNTVGKLFLLNTLHFKILSLCVCIKYYSLFQQLNSLVVQIIQKKEFRGPKTLLDIY